MPSWEGMPISWVRCRPARTVRAAVYRTPQHAGSVFDAVSLILRSLPWGGPEAEALISSPEAVKRLVAASMTDADVVAASSCARAAIRSGGSALGHVLRAGSAALARRRSGTSGPDRTSDATAITKALDDGQLWADSWVVGVVSGLVPELLFVIVDGATGNASLHWAGSGSCHEDEGVGWSSQFAVVGNRLPKAVALLLRTQPPNEGPHFDALFLEPNPVRGAMPTTHAKALVAFPDDISRHTDGEFPFPFPLDRTSRLGDLRVRIVPREAEASWTPNRLLRAFGSKASTPTAVFADPAKGRRFALSQSAEQAVSTLVGTGHWSGVEPADVGHSLLAIIGPLGGSPLQAEQAVLHSLGPVDCYRIPELAASVPRKISADAIARVLERSGWSLSLGLVEAVARVARGTAVLVVDATTGCTRAIASPASDGKVCRAVVVLVEPDGPSRAVVIVPGHAPHTTAPAGQDPAGLYPDRGPPWLFGGLVLDRACIVWTTTETGTHCEPGPAIGYATLPGASSRSIPEATAAIAKALGVALAAQPGVLKHCVSETTALVRSGAAFWHFSVNRN